MSIALVQSKAGGSGSGTTTVTSSAVGYTSTTTAGNLLILVACADGDSTVSISTPVTSGFTWTSATTEPWSDTTGTSYGRTTIFYIANASAMSTTTTVGATGGSTFTDVSFTLYEFSGIATTSAVDVTAIQNHNTATLTTPTTANLSTTATDLIFVAMAAENNTGTAGSGYTLGVASPTPVIGVAQYILNQASGSISTAFGNTADFWACAAASFKASSGVSATPSGVSMTSTQGTATATGTAVASPSGVTMTSSIHAPTATGTAIFLAEFDAVSMLKVTSPLDEILTQGSIPPTLANAFSYVVTTTSITWSWTGQLVYRADNTTTSIADGSQAITGLTASTTYYFYPYYDETTGAFAWVAGGVGSPAYAQTARTNALAQAQTLQTRSPLSSGPMTAATPASSTGGGSDGGSGICVRSDMLVETQERGEVMAIDAELGDCLSCPEGWTVVVGKTVRNHTVFVEITTSYSGSLLVTPSHEITLSDGRSKAAQDLTLLDMVCVRTGIDTIEGLQLDRGDYKKVLLTCDPYHHFYAGKESAAVLAHNIIAPC